MSIKLGKNNKVSPIVEGQQEVYNAHLIEEVKEYIKSQKIFATVGTQTEEKYFGDEEEARDRPPTPPLPQGKIQWKVPRYTIPIN